ncbi:hypothetical protein HYPSUDRAFT_568035 [Hypholoma sublateritium FD-334 SS-4]|uniref:Uncharacterized protein n=1 Tax=Hypholoma sublateritium (strain FD-334 SS-4) TaxID=945553 RepID=A0A0D2LR73_HYPSF|nr:hypothetical protein HYPSUDRAFT_568035 [Hypholoma sublateritium FD-334 SS-4]
MLSTALDPDVRRDHAPSVMQSEYSSQYNCTPLLTPPEDSPPHAAAQESATMAIPDEDPSRLLPILEPQKSGPNRIYQKLFSKLDDRLPGHPLWIPQPNIQLSKEYRAQATLIGDVGTLTPQGGFHFLFNILRHSSDPINPNNLPQDFSPLNPPLDGIDIAKDEVFSKKSHLCSSSVSCVWGGSSEKFVFESSSPEGAILMMPDGATMENVCNLSAVREYVKANGKMLYHYANNIRGRGVKNGGLHVVIGHVKSTSWGIATFCNTSKQSNFHLEFQSLHEPGDVVNPMSWRHAIRCGTADVKVGPDCRENQDLQGLTEEARGKKIMQKNRWRYMVNVVRR